MTPGYRTLAAPLIERLRRDHALLRTLFDALALTRNVRELREALWDLYLTFNGHLDMEETKIAPLLRAGPTPERATAMILEHNEQRRMLRELVEDAERDTITEAQLRTRTADLIATLRVDMDQEEETLLGAPIASLPPPFARAG